MTWLLAEASVFGCVLTLETSFRNVIELVRVRLFEAPIEGCCMVLLPDSKLICEWSNSELEV